MDDLNLNNLIFDPNSFFKEKLGTKVNFKYPLLIMLVLAIFAIGSSFLVMNKFKELFPSDIDSSISVTVMSIGAIGGIIGGLIGTFLYWFILAGILYSISYIFASKGSFKRTLEFVGYGFVPQIFSNFTNFIVMYILISSADFSAQDPQLMVQGIEQIFSNNPLFYTSQIIGILCLLLSAYIWTFALLHARNMSFKNAALTVGIPAGLSIVSQIYSFLFTSGSL
ncbi:YIP1 family protein [Methanosarcina sp. KYL-1]|uniref:YIP1 family protein n=1 Tax=Methanosarcina sp. KYL-1 TaxID=2602068 RepID=UPI002100758B|nr:YIP1 family protein [Methanosarcina sp. KYL-1]MCQ1537195.1 YIP1 family protein [Methanosarcina sp. KYL-1]